VKIADFGISRSLSESHTRLTGKSGRDTSGTLPYMSPQQLEGSKPAATDDIYALGATLYELLTSKPPFFRGEMVTLMLQIRERSPRPLAQQREELEVTAEPIPKEWEETILACLAAECRGGGRIAVGVGARVAVSARRQRGGPAARGGERTNDGSGSDDPGGTCTEDRRAAETGGPEIEEISIWWPGGSADAGGGRRLVSGEFSSGAATA
jgi:serine/threonine protein kinase